MSLDTLTAMRRALETGETTAAALTEEASPPLRPTGI